ncbi:hypothetical protein [Novosphingobium sp. ES2-1]|uniref:hypothetical protein n=1 Tax=Novosphingobium sp. ES2-1 TaxID=2780074 RepID=UPI0021030C33|nr:hypothetical protein [Novosphingobium sp. ES2-1]
MMENNRECYHCESNHPRTAEVTGWIRLWQGLARGQRLRREDRRRPGGRGTAGRMGSIGHLSRPD